MKTVLAIGCHPDDIEFMMSGTLMRLQAAGFAIHYLNVANGCCGSDSLDAEAIVKIRRAEARTAAAMLDAVFHDSLVNDLEVFYERETLARVAALVREIAPDIVLTHYPDDYMEDHSNTCRLAVSATFVRGVRNFRTQPERPPVLKSTTVYHALPHELRDPLRRPVSADLHVDVTDLLERKVEMLACHQSQKHWLDVSQGMDSYLDSMRERCFAVGRDSGVFAAAEGWIRHHHAGFSKPDEDPLHDALGAYAHINPAFKTHSFA